MQGSHQSCIAGSTMGGGGVAGCTVSAYGALGVIPALQAFVVKPMVAHLQTHNQVLVDVSEICHQLHADLLTQQ